MGDADRMARRHWHLKVKSPCTVNNNISLSHERLAELWESLEGGGNPGKHVGWKDLINCNSAKLSGSEGWIHKDTQKIQIGAWIHSIVFHLCSLSIWIWLASQYMESFKGSGSMIESSSPMFSSTEETFWRTDEFLVPDSWWLLWISTNGTASVLDSSRFLEKHIGTGFVAQWVKPLPATASPDMSASLSPTHSTSDSTACQFTWEGSIWVLASILGEIWTEFQVPGFRLTYPGHCGHWWSELSLPDSLSLSHKWSSKNDEKKRVYLACKSLNIIFLFPLLQSSGKAFLSKNYRYPEHILFVLPKPDFLPH